MSSLGSAPMALVLTAAQVVALAVALVLAGTAVPDPARVVAVDARVHVGAPALVHAAVDVRIIISILIIHELR